MRLPKFSSLLSSRIISNPGSNCSYSITAVCGSIRNSGGVSDDALYSRSNYYLFWKLLNVLHALGMDVVQRDRAVVHEPGLLSCNTPTPRIYSETGIFLQTSL